MSVVQLTGFGKFTTLRQGGIQPATVTLGGEEVLPFEDLCHTTLLLNVLFAPVTSSESLTDAFR